jgi:predicted Zn-dependent protease
VTDALVELLDGGEGPVDEALLGVIAHEIGHVRARHGLRMVTESAATATLLAWWVGDYSSVLAGGPTWLVQAQYSRAHERDADAHALALMHAARIDPRAMVRFFTALKKAVPERDGDDPFFGLSSHPADSERVRFFEEGARRRAP